MRELSEIIKEKVVRLFWAGHSYDDIAQQLDIAKGSVVNIVGEFREGYLAAPPGMVEYIDALRKLAVDMKKHDTSISQLKGYDKPHAKIEEIGVGIGMFYEGQSLNSITRLLTQIYGSYPSDSTIYRWVSRFTKRAIKELKDYKPDVGSVWLPMRRF